MHDLKIVCRVSRRVCAKKKSMDAEWVPRIVLHVREPLGCQGRPFESAAGMLLAREHEVSGDEHPPIENIVEEDRVPAINIEC